MATKKRTQRGSGSAAQKGVNPPHLKPYQFKPGQSGNLKGRPPDAANPIRKALKNLTVKTYRDVIEAVVQGNLANLKAMAKDPNVSALQVGVAVAFAKAIEKGDYDTIERIAERIVGKIPDELKVTSDNTNVNIETKTKFDPVRLKLALKKFKDKL